MGFALSEVAKYLLSFGKDDPIYDNSTSNIESNGLFGNSGSNPPCTYIVELIITVLWRYRLKLYSRYQSLLSVS